MRDKLAISNEVYYADPDIKATVVDDRTVEFEGERYSLTALAKKLSGKKYAIAGSKFFKLYVSTLHTKFKVLK